MLVFFLFCLIVPQVNVSETPATPGKDMALVYVLVPIVLCLGAAEGAAVVLVIVVLRKRKRSRM